MARDREQGLRVARAGAARFGLAEDSLRLIHDAPEGDGFVFEGTRGAEPAILKVAVASEDLPARRAKAAFTEYLACGGAAVSPPYRSESGELVEACQDGEVAFALAAYRKAPGKPLDSNDPAQCTPEALAAWGRAAGRFHALARSYAHGYRPCPAGQTAPATDDGPIIDWRQELADFAAWPMDNLVRERWQAVGERLSTLPQPREAFGLIHNDLHPYNMLWDGRTLTVIDFDVAAYHWFVSDLATGLYSHLTFRRETDERERPAIAENLLRPLLAAYRQEHALDADWLGQLPLFLHYRELLLYIVFVNTWGAELSPWQRSFLERQAERIARQMPVVDADLSSL